MSRALRVKEENSKQSLALKKATAEATLGTNNISQLITEFGNHISSTSSNRSQHFSSYTVDGGVSTGTNTTTETSDLQASTAAVVRAQTLHKVATGMQAIALSSIQITSMV